MEHRASESTRHFNCARCRSLVVICRSCDRGNRYCSLACRQAARREGIRDAARTYRQTEAGRQANAERQRRFRARRAQQADQLGDRDPERHVTHQRDAQRSLENSGLQPHPVLADGRPSATAKGRPGARCALLLRPSGLRGPRTPPSGELLPRCHVCARRCSPFTRRTSLRSDRRPPRRGGLSFARTRCGLSASL